MKNIVIDSQQQMNQQNILLQRLLEELSVRNPRCIGIFAALPGEIDLSSLFLIKNTSLAYPRIDGDILTFHRVKSLNELIPTPPHGIFEPIITAEIVIPDLIIVPGLAFTKKGIRLGRGKGHYDRYLNANPCLTISLAFSWQLLQHIPNEPHDVLIDLVLCLEPNV